MKGFAVLVLALLVSGILPLVALETKLVSETGRANSRLIENQRIINTQDDILRTFLEVVRECKSNKEKCPLYLEEWVGYWESKGFTVESGEIRSVSGIPTVTRYSKPSISRLGILRPSSNITDFGILVRKENITVVINGGDWGEWTG